MLAEAYFDPTQDEMILVFTSGASYLYENVPQTTFIGLSQADSVGAFYNKEIKGKFEGIKLG